MSELFAASVSGEPLETDVSVTIGLVFDPDAGRVDVLDIGTKVNECGSLDRLPDTTFIFAAIGSVVSIVLYEGTTQTRCVCNISPI